MDHVVKAIAHSAIMMGHIIITIVDSLVQISTVANVVIFLQQGYRLIYRVDPVSY